MKYLFISFEDLEILDGDEPGAGTLKAVFDNSEDPLVFELPDERARAYVMHANIPFAEELNNHGGERASGFLDNKVAVATQGFNFDDLHSLCH